MPYTVITNLTGRGLVLYGGASLPGSRELPLEGCMPGQAVGEHDLSGGAEMCKKNDLGSSLCPCCNGLSRAAQEPHCVHITIISSWVKNTAISSLTTKCLEDAFLACLYFWKPLLWLAARSLANSMIHFCLSSLADLADQEAQSCVKKGADKWVRNL